MPARFIHSVTSIDGAKVFARIQEVQRDGDGEDAGCARARD